jgi:hypothetical protein
MLGNVKHSALLDFVRVHVVLLLFTIPVPERVHNHRQDEKHSPSPSADESRVCCPWEDLGRRIDTYEFFVGRMKKIYLRVPVIIRL